VAIGGEVLRKPHNLTWTMKKGRWDLFVAWAPIKRPCRLVAAYLNLGKSFDGTCRLFLDYSKARMFRFRSASERLLTLEIITCVRKI